MGNSNQVGPLAGFKVIEMVGLGPGPYCAHLLADLGAEVIMIDRPSTTMPYMIDGRGKKSVMLDLMKPEALEAVLKLTETADIFIEGYRPGVAERLGIGPEVCHARNPKLVYGRMTGWGQKGPWASMAGHDINYLSMTGYLHLIGKKGEVPPPPINLVGDYGGGSMFLAIGVLSATLKAQKTGKGDVIDAAIVDGVSSMMGIVQSLTAFRQWGPQREANILDGGAPFYRCYKTADEKFIAVGCIEAKFFTEMLEKTDISPTDYGAQYDSKEWPAQHLLLETVFSSKTRDEWSVIFDGSDACVTPVLELAEVPEHPHNKARNSHYNVGPMSHPHSAPRFASMQSAEPVLIPQKGADTLEILKSIGCTDEIIKELM